MLDPQAALERLREGNGRFVDGRTEVRYSAAARRRSLEGQQPWAVVVGCSDSRVPVEAVFDVGPGELFVVRTAGHVPAAASLASIRFAIHFLGVRIVVVLGHQDCGAVRASLAGNAPEWLAPIVGHVRVADADPANAPADAEDRLLAAAVDLHARQTVAGLEEWLAAIGLADPPLVVGAAYQLASGEVHWLDGPSRPG